MTHPELSGTALEVRGVRVQAASHCHVHASSPPGARMLGTAGVLRRLSARVWTPLRQTSGCVMLGRRGPRQGWAQRLLMTRARGCRPVALARGCAALFRNVACPVLASAWVARALGCVESPGCVGPFTRRLPWMAGRLPQAGRLAGQSSTFGGSRLHAGKVRSPGRCRGFGA